MLLHINAKFQWENLNHLFGRKVSLASMGMRCPIDQIGMMVIGCSIALDGKWMPLFIMLACWLLDVMLAMMVIAW
jgi:hypothetical protein